MSAADADAAAPSTTLVTASPASQRSSGLFAAADDVFAWTTSHSPDGRQVRKGEDFWDDEVGICRPVASTAARPSPGPSSSLFDLRCAAGAEPGVRESGQ